MYNSITKFPAFEIQMNNIMEHDFLLFYFETLN